jgi:predicted kinase
VDAACLEREQRTCLRRAAVRAGAACVIACCAAPEAILRQRVAGRAARADDASEAGIAVLEHQLARAEALAPDEEAIAVTLDTATADGLQRGVEAIVARLAAEADTHAAH